MALIPIKRTEMYSKRRLIEGSTASIQKSLNLSLPRWAVRCKLVKINKYYEVFAELWDEPKLIKRLVFIEREKEDKEYFQLNSYKNVNLLHIGGICRKYQILPGRYELEEYETTTESGFELIINNLKQKEHDKQRS